jgi:hypothetical protein
MRYFEIVKPSVRPTPTREKPLPASHAAVRDQPLESGGMGTVGSRESGTAIFPRPQDLPNRELRRQHL